MAGRCLSNQLVASGILAHAQEGPAHHYALLFMGNSHSSANDLPGLVARLIEVGEAGSSAEAELAPGWGFLADRLNDGVSRQSLESRPWTHVVLQAQKYSTTGLYSYPTTAAEEWIRRVKAQGAVPVMFPEWPRRGNFEEGARVHRLHLSIAGREPACVAPVGLTWDAALLRHPGLVLHAPDGNHSNLAGALLTAYVFYQLLTGRSADALPVIPSIAVAADTQRQLKAVAAEVTAAHSDSCLQFGMGGPVVDAGGAAGEAGVYEGIPALGGTGRILIGALVLLLGSRVLRSG